MKTEPSTGFFRNGYPIARAGLSLPLDACAGVGMKSEIAKELFE